nr:unnamed protein product [Callosobruchus analis]
MDSHFDFSSVVKPNIVALKILGFWRSSHENSIFNTIWYVRYRSYTVIVILLQVIFEGTGFLYLYDKWECLSLVDITSVIFIYSTGVVNLSMMILIYFNIDSVHFIQSAMTSEMFRPKSQSQAEDAKRWMSTARDFQKLFYGNNITLNVTAIFLGLWRDEKYILVAHRPSTLHWKVFLAYQVGIWSTESSTERPTSI